MKCPKCGTDCDRDEIDVGVGVVTGPWGCSGCGWSEDERYDLSNGQPRERDGGVIDPRGGWTPSSARCVFGGIWNDSQKENAE